MYTGWRNGDVVRCLLTYMYKCVQSPDIVIVNVLLYSTHSWLHVWCIWQFLFLINWCMYWHRCRCMCTSNKQQLLVSVLTHSLLSPLSLHCSCSSPSFPPFSYLVLWRLPPPLCSALLFKMISPHALFVLFGMSHTPAPLLLQIVCICSDTLALLTTSVVYILKQ